MIMFRSPGLRQAMRGRTKYSGLDYQKLLSLGGDAYAKPASCCLQPTSNEGQLRRQYYSRLTFHQRRPSMLLLVSSSNALVSPLATRTFMGVVPTIVRGVLKIRYLMLGGALGGGYSLAKHYEEWKKGLPDTDWIKELIKEVDVAKYRTSMMDAAQRIKGKAAEVDIGN